MIFEQMTDSGLSQYSYLIGCAETGRAAVVDPRRDVDTYLEAASRRDLEIEFVLETHIHADFASGARELALATDAELCLSARDDGEDYEVAFPHRDLQDGERIQVGEILIEALHTPGHTPEHFSYLVYDPERSTSEPRLLLSGDFLFVGSLGRPDLLGEEEEERLTEEFFISVRERIKKLPDHLEVYPGHGSGSMCGSGMSSRPRSTLGFERRTSPLLDADLSREQFLSKLRRSAPVMPPYYKRMKRVNSEGPEILGGLPGLEPLTYDEFVNLRADKSAVVDLRDHHSFGAAHIPNSYAIGAGPNLSVWASWVLPYDRPILLVSPDVETVEGAVRSLIRVGFDQVAGYLEGGIENWIAGGGSLKGIPQISPADLESRLGNGDEIAVLDVRTEEEWKAGHIPGAVHIMGGFLQDKLEAVPDQGRELAVTCGSGYRSTVATSLLEQNGFDRLWNVTGGMQAWKGAGLPVVEE